MSATRAMTKKPDEKSLAPVHQEWQDDEESVFLETGEDRVYFHAQNGNTVSGILIGSDSYEDDEGREVKHFLVHTDRPCEIDTGEKDADTEIAPPGTLVHVNERFQLRRLHQLLTLPVYYHVQIQCVVQKAISGGKKVWRFRIAVKPTKKVNTIRAQATEQTPQDDSNIPF